MLDENGVETPPEEETLSPGGLHYPPDAVETPVVENPSAEGELQDALRVLGYSTDDVISQRVVEDPPCVIFTTFDGEKITTADDFVDGSDAKPVGFVLMEREAISAKRKGRLKNVDPEIAKKERWENRVKKLVG